MKEFLLSEKYRLELSWKGVLYENEGLVKFKSAMFTGPVISDVVGMQPNDSINLDFSKQYSKLVSTYYVAVLSWGNIEVKSDKILLFDAFLKNKYVNSVPKLGNDDYIVIDTSAHEVEHHYKNMYYIAYLLNSDGTLYNFRS